MDSMSAIHSNADLADIAPSGQLRLHPGQMKAINMAIPDGAESARPFLPAKDFEVSKAFYQALGFETLLDGQVRSSGSAPAASSCSAATSGPGPRTA